MSENASLKCFLVLVSVASFLVYITQGCGEAMDPLEARVEYCGPHLVKVTKDSSLANPLYAPQCEFFSFELTVRPKAGIKPNGGIRLEQGLIFNGRPLVGPDIRYCFPDPVIHDPGGPNACRVDSGQTPSEVRLVSCGLGRKTVQVLFPKGLEAQKAVTFYFGDRSEGGPGLAIPTYPVRIQLLTYMDPDGDGAYELGVCEFPWIESYASEADRFKVIAPSITSTPEIQLKVIPMRGQGGKFSSSLPVKDFEGEVAVQIQDQKIGDLVFEKGETVKRIQVRLPEPGVFRPLVFSKSQPKVIGSANPILYLDPKEKKRRIFWGSLQNHTAVGGHSASEPREAFRCASQEGGLDFCAITDHSSNPSFVWEELRTLPDAFNNSGEFVAFSGYEWTSNEFGHRHIILKDGTNARACTEAPTQNPHMTYAPTLERLAETAGQDPNGILIAHHSKRRYDPMVSGYMFTASSSMPRQLLFEIISWHGCSEGAREDLPIHGRVDRTHTRGSGFRDLLLMGGFLGVTGDSDQHIGLPGIPVCIKRKLGIRYGFSGLTAVFSDALTRDSIFTALENRRCYGTTGARILMLFQVGHSFMGEKNHRLENKIKTYALVLGEAPIKRIQIIGDGFDLIHEEQPNALKAELDLELPLGQLQNLKSLYLRVEQADGHMAWSSPIGIQPKKQGG